METCSFFILKGKEDFIDHVKSVNTLNCCYWKKAKNKNLKVGDIVYLYLSGKGHNSIRYKLEVVDTSCERLDKDCWVAPFVADKDCYKLVPVADMYKGHELLNCQLDENLGIRPHTQFVRLLPFQVEYIDKFFK